MVVEELEAKASLRRGDLGLLARTRKLKMIVDDGSLSDGWMGCEEKKKKKKMERDWVGSALQARCGRSR